MTNNNDNTENTAPIQHLFDVAEPVTIETDMEVICMNDLEMKPIVWLWPTRIARGKITVIAGNPGLGKSQVTASLAASVSNSLRWPDSETDGGYGNVIFLSAEDDAADTMKPRLIAAGADVKRCHVIQAIKIKSENGRDSVRSFDLTQDIKRLSNAIAQIGNVRMVVIDPITAYLGKIDSNNNAAMRGALAPLSMMVAEYDVAIILVTHFSKSEKQDAIGRVIGSIGLIAAARAGYAVVKDDKEPEKRYFLPIKNNIGNDKDGFAFEIKGVDLPEGIETSKVVWHEGTVDAHKILYPEKVKAPSATNAAGEFLRGLLSIKPMMMNEVMDEAEGAGYNKAAIQRAANRIGVIRKKLGMEGGWQWSYGLYEDNTTNNTLPSQSSTSSHHEDSNITTEDTEGNEGNIVLGMPSSQSL